MKLLVVLMSNVFVYKLHTVYYIIQVKVSIHFQNTILHKIFYSII